MSKELSKEREHEQGAVADQLGAVADELGMTSATPGLLRQGNTVLQNRFRVKQLLGSGGMGEVYLAEQLSLHRDVALKVLRPAIGSQAGMGERFRREALILSAVDHPAVVRVIDFGDEGGLSFLVMELVEGDTLDIALRNDRFAPERIRRLLRQLAEGLAAVHAHGIVHRDLKPQNVVLCSSVDGEQAKLLDFGIARLSESSSSSLTQAGLTIGTPEYLSPEQALGAPVDHRSDIYSWGVVAYQLLSGRLPFPGPLPQDYLVQHATAPPRPLEPDTQSSASDALGSLALRCLAKDPKSRPSLKEIIEALGDRGPSQATAAGQSLSEISAKLRRRFGSARRASIVALTLLILSATAVAWRKVHSPSQAERVRQFLSQGRAEAALDYIGQVAAAGKPLSIELRMLQATALHGADRHAEEWTLAQDIEGPWVHFEPSFLAAACEDYGRNEKKSALKEIFARFPPKERDVAIRKIASSPPGTAQWGAVRFLDQTGFDGDLTALYATSLKSDDCRVRVLAAKRLGELGDPQAIGALETLRAVPKKRTLIFEQDCGQDEAAAAIRRLKKP